MNHKQKVHLARKMLTKNERKAGGVGWLFGSLAWSQRHAMRTKHLITHSIKK